jgi:putative glutamine amidotransferase
MMRKHFTTVFRWAGHKVSIRPGTRLDEIMGNKPVVQVNSLHHQAIIDPGRAEVSAMSEEKIIEAIELPESRFAVGVQWHPELQAVFSRRQQELFNGFVRACKR